MLIENHIISEWKCMESEFIMLAKFSYGLEKRTHCAPPTFGKWIKFRVRMKRTGIEMYFIAALQAQNNIIVSIASFRPMHALSVNRTSKYKHERVIGWQRRCVCVCVCVYLCLLNTVQRTLVWHEDSICAPNIRMVHNNIGFSFWKNVFSVIFYY